MLDPRAKGAICNSSRMTLDPPIHSARETDPYPDGEARYWSVGTARRVRLGLIEMCRALRGFISFRALYTLYSYSRSRQGSVEVLDNATVLLEHLIVFECYSEQCKTHAMCSNILNTIHFCRFQ